MRKTALKTLAGALLAAGLCASANATVITFTGGVATLNDGTTRVTNNSATYNNVAKYEENGFRVEFFAANGTALTASSSDIGNYYGAGNDVIHGHWATGSYGNLARIKFTKIDGSAFDLNYFILTSNTAQGGTAATGTEKAYIHASVDGTTDNYTQLLPTENWGFPATQIFLGSQFDSVKSFWFDVAGKVDCFGMDSFYINEDAPVPNPAPEPATLALLGLGLIGVVASRRRHTA